MPTTKNSAKKTFSQWAKDGEENESPSLKKPRLEKAVMYRYSMLPIEIRNYIYEFLDFFDQKRAERVCKQNTSLVSNSKEAKFLAVDFAHSFGFYSTWEHLHTERIQIYSVHSGSLFFFKMLLQMEHVGGTYYSCVEEGISENQARLQVLEEFSNFKIGIGADSVCVDDEILDMILEFVNRKHDFEIHIPFGIDRIFGHTQNKNTCRGMKNHTYRIHTASVWTNQKFTGYSKFYPNIHLVRYDHRDSTKMNTTNTNTINSFSFDGYFGNGLTPDLLKELGQKGIFLKLENLLIFNYFYSGGPSEEPSQNLFLSILNSPTCAYPLMEKIHNINTQSNHPDDPCHSFKNVGIGVFPGRLWQENHDVEFLHKLSNFTTPITIDLFGNPSAQKLDFSEFLLKMIDHYNNAPPQDQIDMNIANIPWGVFRNQSSFLKYPKLCEFSIVMDKWFKLSKKTTSDVISFYKLENMILDLVGPYLESEFGKEWKKQWKYEMVITVYIRAVFIKI